ncbi:hypothetical protein ACF3NA_10100 [Alkanindiges sp. WGS2144]|uniref:hypothetical protein n=1 Tax=Alkanindiges sp. WGS2144 TaxID=3366808 RepID=UPI003751F045
MKKTGLLTGLLLLSSFSFATTWTAGSSHQGKVTVPIEGGPVISWQCNGKACSLTGPWGDDLSMDSCQNLVMRVGKISYYKNSAGKMWPAKSTELAQCNQAAR